MADVLQAPVGAAAVRTEVGVGGPRVAVAVRTVVAVDIHPVAEAGTPPVAEAAGIRLAVVVVDTHPVAVAAILVVAITRHHERGIMTNVSPERVELLYEVL
jgi:hypothetical protein